MISKNAALSVELHQELDLIRTVSNNYYYCAACSTSLVPPTAHCLTYSEVTVARISYTIYRALRFCDPSAFLSSPLNICRVRSCQHFSPHLLDISQIDPTLQIQD